MTVLSAAEAAVVVQGAVLELDAAWSSLLAQGPSVLQASVVSKLSTVASAIDPDVTAKLAIASPGSADDPEHTTHVRVSASPGRLDIVAPEWLILYDGSNRAIAIRLLSVLPLLVRLAARDVQTETRFTLSLGDDAMGAQVAFCASGPEVLIPDSDFMVSAGYEAFRQQIRAAWIPWKDRKPLLFWRGSTTGFERNGVRPDGGDWYRILQRTELCHLLQHPKLSALCDVGISAIVQIGEPGLARLITENLTRPRVERADQLGYRYQVDIDGNTNAWSGLFQALLMGACVLKVGSPTGYRQWYYDRLIPWRHFIPVQADLSDIEDKLDWAIRNEEAAAEMSMEARTLALYLKPDREIAASAKTLIEQFGGR